MDKLKNNPSWIVLNSPTQNDPKKVERNNVIYKKQNSKNDPKSIFNNIQKINYANSTQHISKIEFLIIRINQRSQSIADIPIINKLMKCYEEKEIPVGCFCFSKLSTRLNLFRGLFILKL